MERKYFLRTLGFSILSAGVAPKLFANSFTISQDEDKCRSAWKLLCGKLTDNKPFAYVAPQKGLPNVLLYGDSISIGYTLPVRNTLAGKANVFRLFCNGGSSNEFILNMEKMRKTMFQPFLKNGWDFEWDLIHFNVGLHDLKYLSNGNLDKVNGNQVSSIEKYKENLKSICIYLNETYPKAILIFATTTPVPEGEPGRMVGDDLKYNKAALEVLAEYPKIKINDLYSFVKPNFNKWDIKPGNVHYNKTGYLEEGREVAKVIQKYLGLFNSN